MPFVRSRLFAVIQIARLGRSYQGYEYDELFASNASGRRKPAGLVCAERQSSLPLAKYSLSTASGRRTASGARGTCKQAAFVHIQR